MQGVNGVHRHEEGQSVEIYVRELVEKQLPGIPLRTWCKSKYRYVMQRGASLAF